MITSRLKYMDKVMLTKDGFDVTHVVEEVRRDIFDLDSEGYMEV